MKMTKKKANSIAAAAVKASPINYHPTLYGSDWKTIFVSKKMTKAQMKNAPKCY
jgi:hypothetical protein